MCVCVSKGKRPLGIGVALKCKEVWQKINPLAFSLSSDRGAGGGQAYILSDVQFSTISPVAINLLNYHDYGCTNSVLYFQFSCVEQTITARF